MTRSYLDPGVSYYDERYKERKLRSLQRQAKQLGWCVIPNPEPFLEPVS